MDLKLEKYQQTIEMEETTTLFAKKIQGDGIKSICIMGRIRRIKLNKQFYYFGLHLICKKIKYELLF